MTSNITKQFTKFLLNNYIKQDYVASTVKSIEELKKAIDYESMLRDYIVLEQEMDEVFSEGYDGMKEIKQYYELRDKVNVIKFFVLGMMGLEEEEEDLK